MRQQHLEDQIRRLAKLIDRLERQRLATVEPLEAVKLDDLIADKKNLKEQRVREYRALHPQHVPNDLLDDLLPADAPPPEIFLSYRRSDSSAATERLATLLARHFGADHVFFDLHRGAIAPGAEWQQVLDQRLRQADILLVVIGPGWLEARDQAGRRLEQPDDPVRHEIELALTLGAQKLPVLVAGAASPKRQQVPPSIQALFDIQAVFLDDATFEVDFHQELLPWLQRARLHGCGTPRTR